MRKQSHDRIKSLLKKPGEASAGDLSFQNRATGTVWGTHFTFINNKYIIARPSRGDPKKSTHLKCKIFFWGFGVWCLLHPWWLLNDRRTFRDEKSSFPFSTFESIFMSKSGGMTGGGWQILWLPLPKEAEWHPRKKQDSGKGSWPIAQPPQAVLMTEREHSLPRTHHGTHRGSVQSGWESTVFQDELDNQPSQKRKRIKKNYLKY